MLGFIVIRSVTSIFGDDLFVPFLILASLSSRSDTVWTVCNHRVRPSIVHLNYLSTWSNLFYLFFTEATAEDYFRGQLFGNYGINGGSVRGKMSNEQNTPNGGKMFSLSLRMVISPSCGWMPSRT